MCGLVGLAGDCQIKMKDTFTELLLVDVLRGHHSTGAAAVKRGTDEVVMEKAPMASPMFVCTDQYKNFISTVGVKVLMGHNRYATVGEKSAENAHPFQFDNLVGAHNGTLDTWAVSRLEDYKFYGTDSEALYNSISKYGPKDTIAKVSGAWALTWYDRKANTINLLRNSKRPLFYAYSEDRATLFWASEADMLDWILTRNHIKIFDKNIFACEEDKHYRWEVPEKLGAKFEKPILAEVKERTFIQNVRNFSWEEDTGWYDRRGNTTTHYVGTHHHQRADQSQLGFATQQSATKAPTKIDTKKFRPPYKDTLGKIINKEQFQELVASCCVFCDQANTVWGEFIHPLKDDMDGRKLYLCEECYNDDDIRELIENSI